MAPKEKQIEPVEEREEKKPYEKPAIIYQSPLEAMAGACGVGNPLSKQACTDNAS